jgi:radical SAM protein with 4Fe4S-binding SPASM domain
MTLRIKIEKFIFSGKVQGPGDNSLWDYIRLLFKALKIKGTGPVFSYFSFLFRKRKAQQKNKPFVMACFVDSTCNLQCPYCCYGVPDRSYLGERYKFNDLLACRTMTLQDFNKLADNALFKDSLALILTGGEPLINPDLFKIIDSAKHRFPLIHLTTNGTLIEKHIEELMDSALTNINISLDASSPETYKMMRYNDEAIFNRVVSNITLLVKERNKKGKHLKIILSFVVGLFNYREMEDMINFSVSLNVDSVNFQNICGFNCTDLSKETLTIENKDVAEHIDALSKKNYGIHITFPRVVSHDKSLRGCRQCFDSLTVDADGNIGPCSVMIPKNDGRFGNVYRDGANAWNSEFFINLRSSLINNAEKLFCTMCNDCTFLNGNIMPFTLNTRDTAKEHKRHCRGH